MTVPSLGALALQGYTRVPLLRRLLADLDTPLGAYLRFSGMGSFLLESVQGGEITVNGTNGVKVDGATVVQADIVADNGVIHVIDAVIMPKM